MTNTTFTLPDQISIDGAFYTVNTDFRIWINISNIISSDKLNPLQKAEKMLTLCYQNTLPPSFEKAINGLLDFYNCGKSLKDISDNSSIYESPIIDFIEDADLISAAFLHDYQIDLWNNPLHWWKFRALFSALSEDNKIIKIIGYRSANIADIKDKEQKKFFRKMKSLYKLPDKRNPQEIESDMIEKLNSVFEEVF